MHYLMPVVQLYIFLAQWRLVLSESAVLLLTLCYYLLLSLLPWQWFSFTLTLYHKIYELFYLWCQTNQKLQGKLCNKCPSGNKLETAVLVTFLARSLALHRTTEPQEALWHFGGQCGARDCQNCKMCQYDQNVPKLPKNVQSPKSLKTIKNSTFRVKPGILEEVCVRVFCECQSVHPRPRQAQEPCPAFPSWLQPGQGPGALPSCPQVQGKCLASRELPREVTRPRSPSQCPGMCSGQAQEKLLFQPLEIVPRTEKHMVFDSRKTLSWAFILFILTFKKLKFYFSCFKGS